MFFQIVFPVVEENCARFTVSIQSEAVDRRVLSRYKLTGHDQGRPQLRAGRSWHPWIFIRGTGKVEGGLNQACRWR